MPINERRKAAAEWCAEYGEGWSMKDYVRFSRQNVDLATMDAHLAGQECGEKHGYNKAITEVVCLAEKMIEEAARLYEFRASGWMLNFKMRLSRGEHRGGE